MLKEAKQTNRKAIRNERTWEYKKNLKQKRWLKQEAGKQTKRRTNLIKNY